MNKMLTKERMVKILMENVALDEKTATTVVEELTGAIQLTLEARGRVLFKNVGTLIAKLSPPKTMKLINFSGTAPARYKVKFIQSKNMIIDPPEAAAACKKRWINLSV